MTALRSPAAFPIGCPSRQVVAELAGIFEVTGDPLLKNISDFDLSPAAAMPGND